MSHSHNGVVIRSTIQSSYMYGVTYSSEVPCQNVNIQYLPTNALVPPYTSLIYEIGVGITIIILLIVPTGSIPISPGRSQN